MRITRRAAIFGTLAASLAAQQRPDEYPDAAPFVATPPEVAEALLRLASAGPEDVVYDLGSGDGRIVIMAAKMFGAKGVGVEIDGELVKESRENAERAGVARKVRFVQEDIFRADIREASVVVMYLLPKALDRLKPRLLAELKPGSRVVSFAFPMSNWPPAKVQEVNSRRLYLWVVPERGK